MENLVFFFKKSLQNGKWKTKKFRLVNIEGNLSNFKHKREEIPNFFRNLLMASLHYFVMTSYGGRNSFIVNQYGYLRFRGGVQM